jgi:hypothetical protein
VLAHRVKRYMCGVYCGGSYGPFLTAGPVQACNIRCLGLMLARGDDNSDHTAVAHLVRSHMVPQSRATGYHTLAQDSQHDKLITHVAHAESGG